MPTPSPKYFGSLNGPPLNSQHPFEAVRVQPKHQANAVVEQEVDGPGDQASAR